MQRQQIGNNGNNQSRGRRNGGRAADTRSGRRGSDWLYHTVFDDVPLDIGPEDLQAYEKLLHTDLWFHDGPNGKGVGTATDSSVSGISTHGGGVANRTEQIWIESEAVLQELRRQADEDGDTDWEETRKLNLSPHQLAAALQQHNEELSFMDHLKEISVIAKERVSQTIIAAEPMISAARFQQLKLFLNVRTRGSQLIRYLAARGQHEMLPGGELQTADMQVVRSSYPPPPAVARKKRLASIGKIVVVVAAFIFTVTMIFSTPAPQQDFHASAINSYFSKGAVLSLSHDVATSPPVTRKVTHAVQMETIADQVGDENGNVELSGVDVSTTETLGDDPSRVAKGNAAAPQSGVAPGVSANTAPVTTRRNNDANEAPAIAVSTRSASAPSAPAPVPARTRTPATTPTANEVAAVSREETSSTAPAGQNSQVQPNQKQLLSGPIMPGADLQPAQPTLPIVPSRVSVKAAMQRVAPLVAKCRTNQSGQLILKVVISGATGQVVSSRVVDDTFGDTPSGICAMHAVKNAQFPKFQKENLVIRYPFQL